MFQCFTIFAIIVSAGPFGFCWCGFFVGQVRPEDEPATIRLASFAMHPALLASFALPPRKVPYIILSRFGVSFRMNASSLAPLVFCRASGVVGKSGERVVPAT